MMGKLLSRRTRVVVGLFVVALAAASARGQYNAGFVWNRYDDWKCGTSNGSAAGNPGKDSAGRAVWSAEYILEVPPDSGLDTDHPWYLLRSAGLMVWDGHWSGGTWARQYDLPPTTLRSCLGHIPTDKSYRGDHYAHVPLMRWKNPSRTPLTVSLASGSDFLCQLDIGMPTGTVADVVIARTDASDGNSVHVLYRQTVVKARATSLREKRPLPDVKIDNLVLDPGDDILFSIRSRTRTTGFTWSDVAFYDDVTITVVPSRQPERRGRRRLADRQPEAGFTWNRWKDWKPGTMDREPTGNPCKDSAGKGVWGAEYIAKVPCDSGLDSESPWYKLPSSGRMVWDGHWGGGVWAKQYDYPPYVHRLTLGHVAVDKSYHGDHHANVPLLRWRNPSSAPITVSLTSGKAFKVGMSTGMPTGSMADVIIARMDASDGNSAHLLYSDTIVRTADPDHPSQEIALRPLSIKKLVLDPGDNIIFSIRSRTRVVDDSRYLVDTLFDDVTITVLPRNPARNR